MSYCRFVEADVYIYDDISLGIICCACSMQPVTETGIFPGNFVAEYDRQLMLDHIAEHRQQGDYVPEHVDKELKAEMAGEAREDVLRRRLSQ